MTVWMLTTFEDPTRPENPKGGYRRCSEMMRVLAPHFELRHINVSKRPVGALDGIDVPSERIVAGPLPGRWMLTAFRVLQRVRSGDTVLAYNPSLVSSPAALAALTGRRLVIDYVDYQGAITTLGWTHRATRGLRETVAEGLVRTTRWFVTSSGPIAAEIRGLRPDAHVHHYYGTLDHPPVFATPRPPDAPLRVLYVGSMLPVSGAEDLIAAVCVLPPGTVALELAGGGPQRAAVEAAAARTQGRARMIRLDDDALYPALRAADVLALPLRNAERNHYNFPSRIVEFLWAGRAILATDVPPLRGFLRHGETAWMVPSGGPETLRDGLQVLAGDAELRARLGAGARAFFDATLAPGPAGAALVAFLREAAAA